MEPIELDLHGPIYGPFRVPATGTITRALQNRGNWDERVWEVLQEAKGGWALDIGAHVGWFTIQLARRHTRVLAVEPNPGLFELLLWNIARHPGLEHRIQMWPLAAYDRTCALSYTQENDPFDQGGWCFVPRPLRDDPALLVVPAASLDVCLPHDAQVSVIKVDAQGADLRALYGLRETIQRCRPLIVFEWEEALALWHGCSWQDHLDFFHQLNYSVTRISDHGWDFVARAL